MAQNNDYILLHGISGETIYNYTFIDTSLPVSGTWETTVGLVQIYSSITPTTSILQYKFEDNAILSGLSTFMITNNSCSPTEDDRVVINCFTPTYSFSSPCDWDICLSATCENTYFEYDPINDVTPESTDCEPCFDDPNLYKVKIFVFGDCELANAVSDEVTTDDTGTFCVCFDNNLNNSDYNGDVPQITIYGQDGSLVDWFVPEDASDIDLMEQIINDIILGNNISNNLPQGTGCPVDPDPTGICFTFTNCSIPCEDYIVYWSIITGYEDELTEDPPEDCDTLNITCQSSATGNTIEYCYNFSERCEGKDFFIYVDLFIITENCCKTLRKKITIPNSANSCDDVIYSNDIIKRGNRNNLIFNFTGNTLCPIEYYTNSDFATINFTTSPPPPSGPIYIDVTYNSIGSGLLYLSAVTICGTYIFSTEIYNEPCCEACVDGFDLNLTYDELICYGDNLIFNWNVYSPSTEIEVVELIAPNNNTTPMEDPLDDNYIISYLDSDYISGDFTISVTLLNGCVITNSVNVMLMEEFDLQFSANTICDGLPITFIWQLPPDETIDTIELSNIYGYIENIDVTATTHTIGIGDDLYSGTTFTLNVVTSNACIYNENINILLPICDSVLGVILLAAAIFDNPSPFAAPLFNFIVIDINGNDVTDDYTFEYNGMPIENGDPIPENSGDVTAIPKAGTENESLGSIVEPFILLISPCDTFSYNTTYIPCYNEIQHNWAFPTIHNVIQVYIDGVEIGLGPYSNGERLNNTLGEGTYVVSAFTDTGCVSVTDITITECPCNIDDVIVSYSCNNQYFIDIQLLNVNSTYEVYFDDMFIETIPNENTVSFVNTYIVENNINEVIIKDPNNPQCQLNNSVDFLFCDCDVLNDIIYVEVCPDLYLTFPSLNGIFEIYINNVLVETVDADSLQLDELTEVVTIDITNVTANSELKIVSGECQRIEILDGCDTYCSSGTDTSLTLNDNGEIVIIN